MRSLASPNHLVVLKLFKEFVTEYLQKIVEIATFYEMIIFFSVLNVAAGKAPMQSSVVDGGIPQKAVDGSTSR